MNLKNIYLLFYRSGNNPSPLFVATEFPPDWSLNRIVSRCKDHCTNMNYRFVQVKKFFVDLDRAEREQQGLPEPAHEEHSADERLMVKK